MGFCGVLVVGYWYVGVVVNLFMNLYFRGFIKRFVKNDKISVVVLVSSGFFRKISYVGWFV